MDMTFSHSFVQDTTSTYDRKINNLKIEAMLNCVSTSTFVAI